MAGRRTFRIINLDLMHTTKAVGIGDIAQFIGKHSARWRRLVSVGLRPLYLWRNNPLYRLSRKPDLGGGRRF